MYGKRIVQSAKERGLLTAGVFRNARALEVSETARKLDLDVVQLHGDEDPDYICGLRTVLPERTEIWAASAIGTAAPKPRQAADRTIFDTEVAGRSGGTGQTFDWSKLGRSALATGVLAGGLNPANAMRAAKTGAWALDVGSGVESRPGTKDPAKLRAFFEALRPVARNELSSCG
jgi:indole-3-glycerol phosphate synthase/phosphoribosylanthranilate isomerase